MSHGGRVQIGIEGTLAAGIGANGSLTYLFGLDKLHMCPLRRGRGEGHGEGGGGIGEGVSPGPLAQTNPRPDLQTVRRGFAAALEVDDTSPRAGRRSSDSRRGAKAST